ncbi:MAG TPA: copper resistance protein CopC [Gemmatimonadota bacterium]
MTLRRSPRVVLGALEGVALVAAAGIGLAAVVHAHLVSSSPADGEALETPPAAVRLVFSEPIEAGLSRIVLVSARDSIVARVHADSADVNALIGELPRLAAAGYRVDWRVVSADGHPVEGSFAFTVLAPPGADTVRPVAPPPPSAHPAGHAHAGPNVPAGVSAVFRGLAMFSLLVWTGWLIQLVALGGAPVGARRAAVALAATTTVLLAAHAAAWLWHVAPAGRPDVAGALGTGPGRVEALRVGLALLGLWAIGLARRPWIALAIALAAVLASGATGHSAGISPRWSIPIKSLHLIAIAVWTGGVAWLAVAALEPAAFRESTARVSGLALGAVAVVGLTGIAQAALFLPGLDALWGSAYGRLVLAKAAGLAGLVGCGAFNRRRLIPRLAADGDPSALRRSTRRELALMLLVSLLAGVLAYVPPQS